MVQGVRAGSRFFMGNGVFSPIDLSQDFDEQSGLQRGDAPFARSTTNLREGDQHRRRQQLSPGQEQRQQQIPVQMRMGSRPLHDLSRRQQPRFRRGGTFLQVEDGPLTFERGEESLTIEPGTAARFYRSGRQEITLQDRETGEELTFQLEDELTISGEGTGDFGVLSPFELTPGEDFVVEQTEDGPAIAHLASEQTLAVERLDEPPDPEGPLQMEVYRDPQSDQVRDLYYQLVRPPLTGEEEEEEEAPTLAELMEENNNPNNSPENVSNSNPDNEPESTEETGQGDTEIEADEVLDDIPEILPGETENADLTEPETLSTRIQSPPADNQQLSALYSFEGQTSGAQLNLYA